MLTNDIVNFEQPAPECVDVQADLHLYCLYWHKAGFLMMRTFNGNLKKMKKKLCQHNLENNKYVEACGLNRNHLDNINACIINRKFFTWYKYCSKPFNKSYY